MAEVCVVLVEPKHHCNVGFVARAMKNFDLEKLYFSGEKYIPADESFECASTGRNILEKSTNLENTPLDEVFDFIVGTTAKHNQNESSPRNAITPVILSQTIKEIGGRVAILFGREDTGLLNEELDKCDLVVTIPTGEDYPTLNISHAAAILFYAVKRTEEKGKNLKETATRMEKDALFKRLSNLLETLEYPNYKKKIAERIFRRVVGRATLSARDAHTLAGVFKEADDHIKRKELQR